MLTFEFIFVLSNKALVHDGVREGLSKHHQGIVMANGLTVSRTPPDIPNVKTPI